MEKEAIKLELSSFQMWKVIDAKTSECYLNLGDAPILNAGRKHYTDCTEIMVKGYYFGISTFVENAQMFTMLFPYRLIQPKTPKRNYGFGAYDKQTNELFMFFGGKGTTTDRNTAIRVYTSLVNYCKINHPTFNPFSIKL